MEVGLLGGTGMLGGHIAAALVGAGYRVRATYRSEAGLGRLSRVLSWYGYGAGVEYVACDLADVVSVRDTVRGCDVVVQAAASVTLGGTGRGARLSRALSAVAVEGCLQSGVRGLVHVGSIAAVPSGSEEFPGDEGGVHSDYRGLSDYARGKCEAEREALRGMGEGLRVTILNPGVVLGPPVGGRSSGRFVSWCSRGSRFYPKGTVSWVDARDVGACVVRAVELGVPNFRCTLVGGRSDYRELLEVFTARTGGVRPRWGVPWGLACLSVPILEILGWFGLGLGVGGLRSGYSRGVYASSIARTEFGLSYRTLSESVDFSTSFGL